MFHLSDLTTEMRNPSTMELDKMDTAAILKVMNQEDKKAAAAVEMVLPQIKEAVEAIYHAFRKGGRLLYVGAGTSGRLGMMDAAECPPTFMTPPDMIQTVIAGGNNAFYHAKENAEDSEAKGRNDVRDRNLTNKDAVLGITASGRTPYPIGALKYARETGAYTISLSCNQNSAISSQADTAIEVITGPEVLTGSTRLKAATAHKMILNMISTTVMVRLGKVYENLMADVHASNNKLKERAKNTVAETTGAVYEEAERILEQTNYEVKPAIIMILANVSCQTANDAIKHCNGYVRDALAYLCGRDTKSED